MSGFDAKYWFSIAPDWVNYVAMDADGAIWAYEFPPEEDGGQWYPYEGKAEQLYEYNNWRETLTSRSDLNGVQEP